MRARRWAGLMLATGLLVAGVDVPRLDAAPVPAGEADEVVVEPPAMDPGVSSFVTPETPAYKEHEVVAPPVVTVDLTAPADAAAKVGALPVTVQALPEVGVGLASALVEEPTMVADPSLVTDASTPAEVARRPLVEPVPLRVESLDSATVEAMGGQVLVFGVTPASLDKPVSLGVSVDYSQFRYAFGGDWAQRLQLVQWSCSPAQARAAVKSCGAPVPVEGVVNDSVAGVLTARVKVGGLSAIGGGGTASPMLLVGNGSTLGLVSATGSFAATSLSNTGSWSVAGNRGQFSYSVPIATPPAFNGLGPSVSLDYSSDVANGMTAEVNSQASPVGVGWDLSAGQGFIERRYVPCSDSRVENYPGAVSTCWFAQNGAIVLNGRSSELVPINGTTGLANSITLFRLKDDPDWLVERVPGTTANWWEGESWVVTTPEGVRYYFGRSLDAQNSRLVRPIRSFFSGEPCDPFPGNLCTAMPYRWMLDEVVDSFGNRMVYRYEKGVNSAVAYGNTYPYDTGALLTEILYGAMPNAVPAIGFRDRVTFTYVRRCVQALESANDAACPAITNANGASYPDVPTDLVCSASCVNLPSFFDTKRLAVITTQTSSNGTAWTYHRQWRLNGSFPDPGDGTNEKLFLLSIVPVQIASIISPPATPVELTERTVFEGVALRNREFVSASIPYSNIFRVSKVTDDLGRKVDVTYQHNGCSPLPYWNNNVTDCYPRWEGSGWAIYRRWAVDRVVVTDLVGAGTGTGVAPPVTYDYTYGLPGWHWDTMHWWTDPHPVPGDPNTNFPLSYGEFRGYASVTVTVGVGATKTVTRENFYRGMNGNNGQTVMMARTWTPGPGGDGAPATAYDDDWLAGQVWESIQYDGATSNILTATRNYSTWTSTQAGMVPRMRDMSADTIRKWRITLQQSRLRDNTAAAPVWRDSRVDTSLDALGRVQITHSTGFVDVPGDEQCARNFYLNGSAPPASTASPGWMNLVVQTATWSSVGVQPTHSPYAAGACTGASVAVSRTFLGGNAISSAGVALDPRAQSAPASLKPAPTASLTRIKNNSPGTDELDRWTYTRATYDTAGRMTTSTDANGVVTTYGFNSTYGYANTATYPTVNGITMTTSTVLRPSDGQPTTTTDQNARVTYFCYDSLSRLVAGFLPPLVGTLAGDPCADLTSPTLPAANVKYTYSLGTYAPGRVSKEPAIVITSALQTGSTNADAVRIETAAYIDGLGRTRETQAWSPTTGKIIVSANLFDDRGNTVTAIEPFAIDDTAPGDRTSPAGASAGFITWPNLPSGVTLRTANSVYDTANRVTSTNRKNGSVDLVTKSTEYLGTKTISKPQTGSWAATTVDGLGRTTKVEVYNGTTAPAAQGTLTDGGSITTYAYSYDQSANVLGGYDKAGFLTTTMTDDGSNQTVMVTDLAGRTVTSTDPNAGVSQFTYDPAGRVTKTVDAAANTINTAYDVLGRQTGRWKGAAVSFAAAAGADRVASWTYDTVSGGKGMVASETSWQAGAQYVSTVLAYNARYQVTSSQQTIPGTFGTDLLAGDWKFQSTFNEAGQQLSVSTPTGPVDPATPAVLPTFDVTTTGYNGLGAPDRLWQGATSTPVDGSIYVTGTGMDPLGRVTERTLAQSSVGGSPALSRSYGYDNSTGALSTIKAGWTTVGAAPTSWFQDETLTRDAIGNVTQIADNGLEPGGGASGVKECFVYDLHNRLVRAHSAATATGCVTTTSAASVAAGSVDAYDQVWTFDDINRMKSRTNKLTAVATNYTYTGAKHAVTGTTGGTVASFGYNAVGAMTSRAGTTLGYDALQRLTSYGSSESYLYSTSNQRLIRTTGTTRTLYLPGMEVTDTAGVRTLTRYVSIAGTHVATKTTTSTGTSLAWNCASPQNSTVCQADAASPGTIPARKRYLPYGGERNTVSFAGTDHGFLGQPEDTTGLTYLNNRYYDPSLGVFTSVDPLVGRTGTPYLYANGNPTTLSDPGGAAPSQCATVDGQGCTPSFWNDLNAPQTIFLHRLDNAMRTQTEAIASAIAYGGGASAETGFGWTPSSIENGDIRWDDPNYLDALNNMGGDEFIHWAGLTIAAYSFLGPDNPIFKVVSFQTTIDLASEGRNLIYGLSYADMAASYLGPTSLQHRGYLGPQSNLRTFHTPVGECSFSAETGVLMADGTTKPISQIVVGDKVLAYDPTTGERGPREVTRLWVHADVLTELEIDGAKVVTTENHPFWSVTDGEWERADELAVGESVVASDGTLLRVGGLVLTSARLGLAYNLTVAGIHTYYVAVGDETVLVHNECGNLVSDILKNKLGSIRRAPLPAGSPGWDEIEQMTMGQVRSGAQQNLPGYKTILKLLSDGRFNR